MSVKYVNGGKFLLGANLAWLDGKYDHDFGNNPTMNRGPPVYNNGSSSKDNFRAYLEDAKNIGIPVIRLWVFERFEGLFFNSTGAVEQVDPILIENLADACRIAADVGVKFYLCLMDTWTIWYTNDPNRQKLIDIFNGLITAQEKTNSFLDNAVIPLLSDNRIKNSIFAVDIMNEPEGIDRDNTMKDSQHRVDTKIWWSQLVTFIKSCADSIKNNTDLQVSCGFQHATTVQNDPNGFSTHFDFFDYHKYSDTGVLPCDYSSLGLKKPCIIGECGQDTKQWDDDLQSEVICSFLNDAFNKGYAGCFVWNYHYKNFRDSDENWWSLINKDGSHRPVCSLIRQFAKKIK